MTKYTFLISFTLLVIFPLISGAQNINTRTQLANSYFENKEFDKAEVVYKELYKETNADYYFNQYITCLSEQRKFSDAEREIKREIRRHKDGLNFYADLAYIYKEQGEDEKADKIINEAIAKLSSNKYHIHKLSNALMRRGEYERAVQVYEEAERITGRKFNQELANIYSVQRKYPEMINKYMDWLEENPKNVATVQNRLQFFINRDHDDSFYQIMRTELLKRIRIRNSPVINNQMLFWLYMQKRDFRQALIQAKAIDRRTFSSGRTIKELAEAAENSGEYDVALDAWSYLSKKGEKNLFHIDAELGKLNVLYLKIENDLITDKTQISEIAEQYKSTLEVFGLGHNTIGSIINLANIQAFYLDEGDKADALLQRAAAVRGLAPELAGLCKITRGDILVLQDKLWDAALLYAQAETENKDHSIGDRAKLKKAFVAYYGQQYEWALAQFDALKKSTSKEVANDALKYAIFIKGQLENDSLHRALSAYSGAELLQFRKRPEAAILRIDSLIENYPSNPIKVYAYMKRAELSEETGHYTEAETFYKKVISEYGSSVLKPTAVFRLGILYEDKLNNPDEASHYYKKIIMENPESIHTNAASKRLRAIRDGNTSNTGPS